MRIASTLFAILLSLSAPGCGGDDDDGDDTGTIDGGTVDAAPIDAGGSVADARDFCADYCTCMPANCPTQYNGTLGGSLQSCRAACEMLSATTAECRALHCGMATGAGASLHCPHSIGQGECTAP